MNVAKLRHHIPSIIMSLLCMLPLSASGQTSVPYVKPKVSDGWYDVLTKGGMRRNSSGWYMQLSGGIQDLIVMNYVDGYSYGPHAIWGHVNNDRSRWELEETVRWASGREQWVAKGSLRYIWPVEYQSFVLLYGGQHMEDFDEDPIMPQQHSLMATGIFGWNHYKLLERTQLGVRASTALNEELQWTADVRWERRVPKENTRWHNVFGALAESNVPRIRDAAHEPELTLYDGPIEAELMKMSMQLDFQHDQRLYVLDDMTASRLSTLPLYSLKIDLGQGLGQKWKEMRFLSLDLSMKQSIVLERGGDHFRYQAGAGMMWSQGEVGLADWHHLDASRFWWQRSDELTRFALLDNYELSSDRWWSEAHAEWSSDCLLLTQLTEISGLCETLQLHVAQVARRQTHWEYQYGWDFFSQIKLGVHVGFNNLKYAGVLFGMTLNLQ